MTTPAHGGAGYAPAPRRGIPGWAWGIGACACLPIVGVVLLGLLAAPALKRARLAGREALNGRMCINNVGELARSLQMYAQDYDDRMPVSATWLDGLAPYASASARKISGRPALQTPGPLACPSARAADKSAVGYAFNSRLSGKVRSKMADAATTAAVYDSTNGSRNATDAVSSLPNPARHVRRPFRNGNHSRFNVMGYADGHVNNVDETGAPVAGGR